jgi:eukaryotic-like serine/threonine-protein kinase
MASWQEKWVELKRLTPGGQGDTYLVAADSTAEPKRFLKVLRENREERRNRMRREIACYTTLLHPAIPALIDSNVLSFDDETEIPYLVSEFVEGDNLSKVVTKRILSSADSMQLTLKLLEIVGYAHSQETVHRDIKPDNIVLRGNSPSDPVLIDFGMSFYEGEDELTPHGQEIGNRFLRLPEFFAGSSNQRDPRSDVTQCLGILFFSLTGITPRALRDHDGNAPHQSTAGREALSRHTDIDLLALLRIFDHGFDGRLHARWENAASLIAALEAVRIGESRMDGETPDEMIARIKAQLEGHEESRLQQRSEILTSARTLLGDGTGLLYREIPGLALTSGNNVVDTPKGIATGMVGLVKGSDHNVGYRPLYMIELQGDEIVITIDHEILFRGLASIVTAEPAQIVEKARDFFLRGLTKQLGS